MVAIACVTAVIRKLQAASGWRAVRFACAGARSTLVLDGEASGKRALKRLHGYPSNPPGYHVPHAVQVHYRACPTDLLLPWNAEVGQSTFINSLKVMLLHIQSVRAAMTLKVQLLHIQFAKQE